MKNSITKSLVLAGVIISGVGMTSTAQARGCIKGAIVGGIAGHMVHHGTAGAIAGCAVGHHQANKAHKVKTNHATHH